MQEKKSSSINLNRLIPTADSIKISYLTIENMVVKRYKTIETMIINKCSAVNNYCIAKLFSKNGESIEETQTRLKNGIECKNNRQ